MQTDWKIDVAMVDSMGDPLHNVMHSVGTDSVMGWNTVCYTGLPKGGSVVYSLQTETFLRVCQILLNGRN